MHVWRVSWNTLPLIVFGCREAYAHINVKLGCNLAELWGLSLLPDSLIISSGETNYMCLFGSKPGVRRRLESSSFSHGFHHHSTSTNLRRQRGPLCACGDNRKEPSVNFLGLAEISKLAVVSLTTLPDVSKIVGAGECGPVVDRWFCFPVPPPKIKK
jgi:hypothetical protein